MIDLVIQKVCVIGSTPINRWASLVSDVFFIHFQSGACICVCVSLFPFLNSHQRPARKIISIHYFSFSLVYASINIQTSCWVFFSEAKQNGGKKFLFFFLLPLPRRPCVCVFELYKLSAVSVWIAPSNYTRTQENKIWAARLIFRAQVRERERERENEGGLAWGFCLERFSLLVAASSAPTWFIISMMMMNRWTSSKGRHYITVSWVSRTMKRGRNRMPTMEITTERQERRKDRKKGNKISWSWFEIPARVFLLFRQQYIIQTGCLSLSLSLFSSWETVESFVYFVLLVHTCRVTLRNPIGPCNAPLLLHFDSTT